MENINKQRSMITRSLSKLVGSNDLSEKTKRELRKLESSYNKPFSFGNDESMNLELEHDMEMTDYEMGMLMTDEGEPNTFHDAWFHPDMEIRKKWREAIKKEICCMLGKEVWEDMTEEKIMELRKENKEKKPLVINGYSR